MGLLKIKDKNDNEFILEFLSSSFLKVVCFIYVNCYIALI